MDFLLVLIELYSLGQIGFAIRAKIDRQSTISLQRGQFDSKFQVEWVATTNHFFARIVKSMNAFQLCCWQFSHTKKNLYADFLQVECDFWRKPAVLCFWAPLWGLRIMYDDHLRLIGKRVVDFLLVLIDFFARCYGWGAASEYRFKIGDFAPTRACWPKISGRRGHPINHYFCQKTRLNDLSYGIKTGLTFLPFCHNSRVWQTDRRTDRILIAKPRLHSKQGGKTVFMFIITRRLLLVFARFLSCSKIWRNKFAYKN